METRPGVGIVLTLRSELIVTGQAFHDEPATLIEDDQAILGSMQQLQHTAETNEWFIPEAQYRDYSIAIGAAKALYSRLASREDRGSWCENSSPQYRVLANHRRTATRLLEGLFTEMGVPEVWQPHDD